MLVCVAIHRSNNDGYAGSWNCHHSDKTVRSTSMFTCLQEQAVNLPLRSLLAPDAGT
jgi:hypothetical protein